MNSLCDTNSVSELMKLVPNPMVEKWFSHQEIIFVSAITVEEIYFGLSYKDARQKWVWFEKFVQSRCKVLPVTTEIAKQCGILRGQFRKKGISRSQADLLIAATALQHHLVLVTRNTRDFQDCGIQLFNPFAQE